jgi:hypothetical protein
MAKIKGLELTKVQKGIDHDGCEYIVGAIVKYKGKAVGTYEQTFMGGECLDVPQELFDKFKDYDDLGIESIIYNLLDLMERERVWKKNDKKGQNCTVYVNMGGMFSILSVATFVPIYDEMIKFGMIGKIKEKFEKFKDLDASAFTFYNSPRDFIIN